MTVSEAASGTATPGRDFDRLWLATATSQAGSTIAYGALPLVAVLVLGFAWFTVANFGLILCAGVFNPTFATYRMRETADDHMSRVQSAWSITMKVAQPIGVLAAGALAAATSPRTAIAVAGGVLLLSSGLLPWRPAVTKTPTCE